MLYTKRILTFDIGTPLNTPVQYGTSVKDDCITSGFRRMKIVGNPGAIFSLKSTRITNVNTTSPTTECSVNLLVDALIPSSGVYVFNYNFIPSTTINRYDIQITPGANTVLGELVPSGTPTYSVNQYPPPVITLTSASSTLSGVTESGAYKTYKGEIRHAPDSTDEYNKLTYTRTISHGSKPLYVSKVPQVKSDYASSLDIKKIVKEVDNSSDIEINPYVKSGDTAITYDGDVKVGMSFTGEITYTKNFISYVINDVCKDCVDSSNILRLTDTKNIEAGMLVGAIGITAKVMSIENDTDIVISIIPPPEVLKRETTLTFIKTVGGRVSRVKDVGNIVVDSRKTIPNYTVLTFNNNETEISGDISVTGSGSTELTITGEVFINKVGKESVTYTQQTDDFVTFTPQAYDRRIQVTKNTAKSINFLGSDFDINYASKTGSIVTNPKSGTVSEVSGVTTTYTPNTGFLGKDSFTFKVNDGTTDSEIKTINITVN